MDINELLARTNILLGQFERLRIKGDGWSGNARTGFAYNPNPTAEPTAEGQMGTGVVLPPPVILGACCHLDGTCSLETRTHCNAIGGYYQGDDTVCADYDCTCTGACCHIDCSCTTSNAADCPGVITCGATCASIVCCPTTAVCCYGSSCYLTTPEICAAYGGSYFPDLHTCSPNPCIQIGTCCNGAGNCFDGPRFSCYWDQPGTVFLLGTSCSFSPCDFGACCGTPQCICSSAYCDSILGTYVDGCDGCAPDNTCCTPYIGACCLHSGTCFQTTSRECTERYGGTFFGVGSSCTGCVPHMELVWSA